MQADAKTREGRQHPDRAEQFCHLNDRVAGALAGGQPAISVATKKELGNVAPFGVYDLAHNEGFVSVGVSNDTAPFSVASIRAWWQRLGRRRFPAARGLLITADCGGSNGNRTRLRKVELQKLADQIGLPITVCHFPPGTSKWNRIEHRLFSFISINWRGKTLISHQVIINLIAATTTRSGLKVHAGLDQTDYPRGIRVSNRELAAVDLIGACGRRRSHRSRPRLDRRRRQSNRAEPDHDQTRPTRTPQPAVNHPTRTSSGQFCPSP